jgi:deazaflavin-dependent oxidoreductase (nitroreductase family)
VTGRVSGDPRQVAVTSVNMNGVKYLVSTRGESQWVKNIRANPNVTLTVKGKSTAYVAAEVPVQDRAPVIAAFRPMLGKLIVGRYFAKLPADADHPIFALAPTSP